MSPGAAAGCTGRGDHSGWRLLGAWVEVLVVVTGARPAALDMGGLVGSVALEQARVTTTAPPRRTALTGTARTRLAGWLDAVPVEVDVAGAGADQLGAGGFGATRGAFLAGSRFMLMAQCKQVPDRPARTGGRSDLLRYRLRVRDRQGWQ